MVQLKLPIRLTYQRQNEMIMISPLDQVLGSPGTQSVVLRQILLLTTQCGCPHCYSITYPDFGASSIVAEENMVVYARPLALNEASVEDLIICSYIYVNTKTSHIKDIRLMQSSVTHVSRTSPSSSAKILIF